MLQVVKTYGSSHAVQNDKLGLAPKAGCKGEIASQKIPKLFMVK